jgi:hypothetical protein
MYGLVNKAVEGLVISQFGEEIWAEIKAEAGVDVDAFVSMESYDDEITYKLVGAASKVLKTPAEEILRLFGQYWVLETAAAHYGDLMTAAGTNLPQFLSNLDQMHSRVQMSFPKLRPPSFKVTVIDDHTLTVTYYSQREGLEPFVIGLIEGLGKHFETSVQVELIRARETTEDPADFRVQHGI